MRRRLSTLLSAASLVLCVAMAVLWVRSWSTIDLQRYHTGPGGVDYHFDLDQGAFVFARARWESMLRQPAGWSHDEYAPGDVSNPWYNFPVFGTLKVETGPEALNRWSLLVRVPFWLLFLLLGWPAYVWLWRRWNRRGPGCAHSCSNCGYDLRASPGRCPECGAGRKGAP